MIPLQKPDFQILQWSSKDVSSSSAEAMILGAPLQDSFSLYEDLQKAYLTTTHTVGELEVNALSEGEKEGSSEFQTHKHSPDTIETKLCPAYAPACTTSATFEPHQDDDYI
jgi:hypothetical protein